MTGYTKLFGSIVNSTIWREDNNTRILWITMLAMAGKEGIVESSLPGLADAARLSIDDTKAALVKLSAPDEYSRTRDHEGRRIEEVDGGWRVLNHGKYRAKMSSDERREYFKLKKRQQRAEIKTVQSPSTKSTNVTHSEAAPETKEEASPYPPESLQGAERVSAEKERDRIRKFLTDTKPENGNPVATDIRSKRKELRQRDSELLKALGAAL